MKENTEIQKNSENLSNLELTNDEVKSLLALGEQMPLTQEAAVKAAKQFFSQNVNTLTKADELAVSEVFAIENDVATKDGEASDGPIAYAVNFGDNEGFVVVKTDNLDSGATMYSNNGRFDANDEFMQYMMENLKYASISKSQQNVKLRNELAVKTLEKISRHSGVSTELLKKSFTGNVVYGTAPEKTDAVTKGGMPEYYYEVTYSDWWIHSQAGPLLTTKMHRGAPYNSYVTAYGVTHHASPDVIAIGQIMAYYEKPKTYMWKDTLRVFNWQQIKADYWTDSTSFNRDAAVFIGALHTMLKVEPRSPIATDTRFAVYNDIKGALLNSDFVYGMKKLDLHTDESGTVMNNILSDVEIGRPVYMFGQGTTLVNNGMGGVRVITNKHSWVIDGYQQQRRVMWNKAFYYDYDGNKIYEPDMSTDTLQIMFYLHFNLGIDRSCLDLYCDASSFIFPSPNGTNFNTVKTAIVNLYTH